MLTLPFRLAATLFIALFCASGLVRRAVAGIAVSAAIVAAQHGGDLGTLAPSTQAEPGLAQILIALASAVSG
jgi:hypothetical protein